MYPSLSEFYQDEAWRELAADIEDFVGELVDQSGSHKLLRELSLRLVRLKLGHLKLRLGKLKQSLQSYLGSVEEKLLLNSRDEEARSVLALGAERLADMWLMEGLLQRLGNTPIQQPELPLSLPLDMPSKRASGAGKVM